MTRPPAIRVFLGDEVVADNFAGGGGASSGIEIALGRSPDLAINHDPEAIAMHAANHPTTRHFTESIWQVDPIEACGGRRVALAWFSPDCKHFSKAKGGKPRDQKIRGLAWSAVRWAKTVKPRVIALENVEEFREWGPLVGDVPCPRRKGQTFRAFIRKLERYVYRGVFGAPKTASSRRALPLPAEVSSLLPARRQPDDLVFPNTNGEVYKAPGKRFGEILEKLCTVAGVPTVTPHGLRRTANTTLLEAGIKDQLVRSIIGHADAGMTQRYYHANPAAKHHAVTQALAGLGVAFPVALGGGKAAN